MLKDLTTKEIEKIQAIVGNKFIISCMLDDDEGCSAFISKDVSCMELDFLIETLKRLRDNMYRETNTGDYRFD